MSMPDDSLSATLAELERKLRELEQRLSASAPAHPAPPPAPVPAAPAAGPPGSADHLLAEARARLSGVGSEIDELLRFREQLQRTARELQEELDRVLARLGGPVS